MSWAVMVFGVVEGLSVASDVLAIQSASECLISVLGTFTERSERREMRRVIDHIMFSGYLVANLSVPPVSSITFQANGQHV